MNNYVKSVTTREDIQAVALLADRIWHEHYEPIIGAAQVDYMLRTFQSADAMQRHIAEGYHYGVAVADGVMAGYCAFRYEPETKGLFLSKLYVEQAYRGKGLAKAMLAFCLDASEQPPEFVWLTVNKHNADSIAAYRRMGFTISSSLVTDIGQGYVMDDYRMEKKNF